MLVHNHVTASSNASPCGPPASATAACTSSRTSPRDRWAVYSRHSGFTLETMTVASAGPGRAGPGHRRPHDDHRWGYRRPGRVPGHAAASEMEGPPSASTRTSVERIGSLSGKVAVIHSRAHQRRAQGAAAPGSEDALSATRARWPKRGAGGGAALLHAHPVLDELESRTTTRSASHRPADAQRSAHLIASNAGYDASDVVAQTAELGRRRGLRRA